MTELTDKEKVNLLATKVCRWHKQSNWLDWFDKDGKTVLRRDWNPLSETRQGLMDAFDVVDALEKQGWMWIAERFGAGGLSSRKRFVKNGAMKRYACLSKEEAKESFLRRKQAQIKILKRQLMWAETAMNWFGRPEEK